MTGPRSCMPAPDADDPHPDPRGDAGLPAPFAAAAEDDAQAAIRGVLRQWTADFNARNADKICELFEPGLIYDFQGLPEQRYDDICPRLKRALGDESRSWTYAKSDIKEILEIGRASCRERW